MEMTKMSLQQKLSLHAFTDMSVKKLSLDILNVEKERCLALWEYLKTTNQTILRKKLLDEIEVILKEEKLLRKGYDEYVETKDNEHFLSQTLEVIIHDQDLEVLPNEDHLFQRLKNCVHSAGTKTEENFQSPHSKALTLYGSIVEIKSIEEFVGVINDTDILKKINECLSLHLNLFVIYQNYFCFLEEDCKLNEALLVGMLPCGDKQFIIAKWNDDSLGLPAEKILFNLSTGVPASKKKTKKVNFSKIEDVKKSLIEKEVTTVRGYSKMSRKQKKDIFSLFKTTIEERWKSL